MRKLTYFGVFEPSADGGFGVFFPDLPGCISYGETLENARKEAADALGLHIYGMEKDGDDIPAPSASVHVDLECAAGSVVCPVSVFPDIVKNEINNRAVRVSTTIPTWVKELAEEQKVNYSQVLQAALLEVLDVPPAP